ncbi:MAG TPA: hypothetical protein VK095_00755 [Beutenbergiaceae bacterium]|nr:hypothetical protein [Beutenbergiaceae bacterium]
MFSGMLVAGVLVAGVLVAEAGGWLLAARVGGSPVSVSAVACVMVLLLSLLVGFVVGAGAAGSGA